MSGYLLYSLPVLCPFSVTLKPGNVTCTAFAAQACCMGDIVSKNTDNILVAIIFLHIGKPPFYKYKLIFTTSSAKLDLIQCRW